MFKSLKAEKFLLIPFYILILGPVIKAGFYWDDVQDSLVEGYLKTSGYSFWQYCYNKIHMWIFEFGRPFVVSVFLGNYFFYLFSDPLGHHLAKSVLIFLSMISVGWMLKLLTKNSQIAVLFLFLVPLFFSIQNWCDSLVAFGLLLPMVTIFSSLAVCFYLKFEESKKRSFIFLSLLFLFCGLLTYEIAIVAFFVVLFLALRDEILAISQSHHKLKKTNIPKLLETRPKIALVYGFPHKRGARLVSRKKIKNITKSRGLWYIFLSRRFWFKTFPYCLLVGIWSLFFLVLRFGAKNSYNGVQFGNFAEIPGTFAWQVLATLPLNSFLFERVADYSVTSEVNYYWALLLFPISFIALYRLLPLCSLSYEKCKTLNIIGFIFLLIPAAMISWIGKYQSWIFSFKLGYGYTPLYMQYIGLCLIFMSWLAKVFFNISSNIRSQRIVALVLSLLLSCVICFSVSLNYRMVNFLNKNHNFNSKDLIRNSAEYGLMNDFENVAVIPREVKPQRFLIQEVISGRKFSNQEQEDFSRALAKYPTIFWSLDCDENFVLQNMGFVANITKVNATNPDLPLLKSFNSLAAPSDRSFFIDAAAVGDYQDGYVILGRLELMRYAGSDDQIKALSYKISNPVIFINNKSGQNFSQIVSQLALRFNGNFPKNNAKNSKQQIIEMPAGTYSITPR